MRLVVLEVAHNVVEAIARHPQTCYRESYYRFHLLKDIDEDDDKFVDCAITAGADPFVLLYFFSCLALIPLMSSSNSSLIQLI